MLCYIVVLLTLFSIRILLKLAAMIEIAHVLSASAITINQPLEAFGVKLLIGKRFPDTAKASIRN